MGDARSTSDVIEFVLSRHFAAGGGVELPADSAPVSRAGACSFSRWYVDGGGSSDPEAHAEHEIWFVVSGQGQACVNDRTTALEPGAAIYLAPGERHVAHNRGAEPLVVFSVWWGPDVS